MQYGGYVSPMQKLGKQSPVFLRLPLNQVEILLDKNHKTFSRIRNRKTNRQSPRRKKLTDELGNPYWWLISWYALKVSGNRGTGGRTCFCRGGEDNNLLDVLVNGIPLWRRSLVNRCLRGETSGNSFYTLTDRKKEIAWDVFQYRTAENRH